MPGIGGASACIPACRPDMQLPHQPVDPFSGTGQLCAGHMKQTVQSQGGILLMQRDQMPGKPLILQFSGADAPMKPGVVAAAGDFQKPA